MRSVAKSITPKQMSAIERIKASPALRPMLFRKAVGLQWFRPFNEAGFLSPIDIPSPVPQKEEGSVSIPVWPITNYLVATSSELLDPTNEVYAVAFMDFIRTATRHAKTHNFGNYRVWWQFAKIICNVPLNLITRDDLELFDYWLDDKYERGLVAEILGENWTYKLLDRSDRHAKDIALDVIEILYKTQIVEKPIGLGDGKDAVFRFDSWHAKKITNKLAAKAGQELRGAAVSLFQKHLEAVLTTLGNDKWSSVRRRAIENHAQNAGADDAEDILIEAHRDALLAYVRVMPQEASNYVTSLLEGTFETLQRIAIYAIDQRYEELKPLTEGVLNVAFFQSNFRHELWHLLTNHYPLFPLPQKKLVKDVIASLIETDDSGQASEAGTAYRRSIWLSSIKDYDEDVAALYRQCVDTIGGEPGHPDFSSYISSGYVDHKSPIPQDELLSLDVPNLVERLSSYRDPGRFGQPGIEGLVKTLRQAIKAQPLQFHKHLQQFIDLDLAYVHEVIEAYRELWIEVVQLPWDDIWGCLLEFCEALIRQERFWSPENETKRSAFVANRFWIIGSISMLLQAGTQSDEHAFPERYLIKAESILRHILDKEEGEEFKPESDAVAVAINSPRGRCFEALINLVLRSCRLANEKHGGHSDVWEHFRPTFDAVLAQDGVGSYEGVTLIARHLPQFLYLSNEWVQENFAKIFDQTNHQKWLCAIQGYSYVNVVYDQVYRYLRESGDLRLALDDENTRNKTDNKIAENIAIAYLNGFERLEDEDNLIDHLVMGKHYSELNHFIWFVWTLREHKEQLMADKVLNLWRRFMPLVDPSTKEGKQLGSKLCDWIVFINDVNDLNRPLIYSVIACTDENHFSYGVLENIARISDQQPEEAFYIWQHLLQVSSVGYPSEAIQLALRNLIRDGAAGIQKAKDIASQYLKAGNEEPYNMLQQMIK